MAVYKRGYQRYRGPVTGPLTRLLVVPRFGWKRLMGQRLVMILLIVSCFWPLACATFIYVSNHLELLQGMGPALAQNLKVDGKFFAVFMNTQAVFAVFLAAFAGPSLVAPDLAGNALPLYFSRPMSRLDYVFSRMLVLVGLLSPVTLIPGLILFAMQSGMAGWSWFAANWNLGLSVFAGFVLWIVFVSLVAMASSAYVKWRIIAGAVVIAFFFVLAGVGGMVNAILRVDWGMLINPALTMNQVWRAMMGTDPLDGPEALDCLSMIGAMAVALIWILNRKLRPVEVVS